MKSSSFSFQHPVGDQPAGQQGQGDYGLDQQEGQPQSELCSLSGDEGPSLIIPSKRERTHQCHQQQGAPQVLPPVRGSLPHPVHGQVLLPVRFPKALRPLNQTMKGISVPCAIVSTLKAFSQLIGGSKTIRENDNLLLANTFHLFTRTSF